MVWTACLAAALATAAPSAAGAATRSYPGPAPCDGTLQACITGADEGDAVQIATNGPIDEGLLVEKSITLEPAPGYVATLGTGLVLRGVQVDLSGAGRTVIVRGLRMPFGRVTVDTEGTGNHSITVADCFIHDSTPSGAARGIIAGIGTPGTLRLQRNDIVANGGSIDLLTVGARSGVIEIDVVGNRVRKASAGVNSDGIRLALLANFEVTARVYSNVVYDVGDCGCGYPAGITLTTLSAVQTTAYIVNNTIDQSAGAGIGIPSTGTPAPLTAYIYNNIVTRSAVGIELPPLASGVVLNNGFNALFQNTTNDFGGYPPGPGTVTIDPLLVDRDARDYHLLPGSSLVHAGIEPPGGLPAIDADGNARVAGAAVDYGAFELGSTPPTTTTTVSTTPTSTTLPGCAAGATFASVRCRLADLAAAVSAGVPPGKLAIRLAPSRRPPTLPSRARRNSPAPGRRGRAGSSSAARRARCGAWSRSSARRRRVPSTRRSATVSQPTPKPSPPT
jgi:hypothetical protein